MKIHIFPATHSIDEHNYWVSREGVCPYVEKDALYMWGNDTFVTETEPLLRKRAHLGGLSDER